MQKFIPSRPGRYSDDFAPRVIRCPETHHVDAVRSAVRRRRETGGIDCGHMDGAIRKFAADNGAADLIEQ